MAKGPLAYPTPFWLLGPLALISGCAAMLHVLVQLAEFAYVHGLGVATQTVVLATFVGGFAIGTILVGLRSDRSQHPLRWFGLLQLGLGCFVLGAPTLTAMLGDVPALSTHAVALLLLPGLLAGGSATVLVRSLVACGEIEKARDPLSRLLPFRTAQIAADRYTIRLLRADFHLNRAVLLDHDNGLFRFPETWPDYVSRANCLNARHTVGRSPFRRFVRYADQRNFGILGGDNAAGGNAPDGHQLTHAVELLEWNSCDADFPLTV